jgi:K+-transporting ATPase KdpF subunit
MKSGGGVSNEPRNLAAGNVSFRPCRNGALLPVLKGLRQNIEDEGRLMMIYLTAIGAAFLFVYLLVALIRPEWF